MKVACMVPLTDQNINIRIAQISNPCDIKSLVPQLTPIVSLWSLD